MSHLDPPADHWTNRDAPELTEAESLDAMVESLAAAADAEELDRPLTSAEYFGALFLADKRAILQQCEQAQTWAMVDWVTEGAAA